MVAVVVAVAHAASRKNALPVDELARVTVVAAATGVAVLKPSCVCTVAAPEQMPTATVCAEVAKASTVGAAGLTTCPWMPLASPPPETVSVGAPDLVSFQ